MQSYTEIPSSQSLQSSLALLLNNDKTALSCSSGSAFPNSNLQVGMLCLRTDKAKLYQLKDLTPTWVMIADLNSAAVGNLATTGTSDLNTITTSGFYRVEIPSANGAGSNYGQLLVIHGGGDTITQIYGDHVTGNLMTRSGNPSSVGGSGSWSAWRKLWHDGNDGAGSGLDADLLDGMASGNASGNIPINNGTLNTNLNADMVDGKHVGNGSGQVPLSNGVLNTDLNADMLDGFHASAFVRTIQGVAPDASGNVVVDLASKVSKVGDTMSGNLTVTDGAGAIVLNKTGDLTCYRTGGTTGVLYLNQAGSRYVYWDGTNYNMPGGNLLVNGYTVWHTGNIGTPLNAVGTSSISFSYNGAYMRSLGITFGRSGNSWTAAISNCNCTCTCCFTAGTKVTMADGSVKAVEDVQPGEVVRGLFGQENIVLDQIVCHIEPGHNTYVINGEVRMTGEHLLWTGNGWAAVDLTFYSKWHADRKARGETVGIDPIKVRQLEVGDRVFNDGALVVVESLEVQVAESDEDLFSFELTGDKTFVANGYGVESKTFTEGFAHV